MIGPSNVHFLNVTYAIKSLLSEWNHLPYTQKAHSWIKGGLQTHDETPNLAILLNPCSNTNKKRRLYDTADVCQISKIKLNQ